MRSGIIGDLLKRMEEKAGGDKCIEVNLLCIVLVKITLYRTSWL
jgi:hypothetical protein